MYHCIYIYIYTHTHTHIYIYIYMALGLIQPLIEMSTRNISANLRHGTGGFTSPPKEGVLRIFSPLKIRRLRPGLNPRTWVLKASTLPLDHRRHKIQILFWQHSDKYKSINIVFIDSLLSLCVCQYGVTLLRVHYTLQQCFSTFVRPRPGTFFFL